MKILIPTDGSEFSRAAIEQGCKIASDQGRPEIKILSIYEPHLPIGTEPFALSADYYAGLDKLGHAEAESWVNEAVDLVRSTAGDEKFKVSTMVERGTPAQCIIDTVLAWRADLVIMGSHGRGFWGRLSLGSVSDAVLHKAPCAVMIAKAVQRTRPGRPSKVAAVSS